MSDWFRREGFVTPGPRKIVGPLRVGVVSRHFFDQSVWHAIVKGWLQKLDRTRFSIHAFYLGREEDAETRAAKAQAAHFEQGARSLRQWVESILHQRLDVVIYPEVGMDTTTLQLASLRLAPVQLATWGHPETSGLATIDYFLSAEDLEPPNAQQSYTENLVLLPRLGCWFQASGVNAIAPDLASYGMDPNCHVLLCPGTPYKYAPEHDGVFIEIARRLGRCKFVFFTYKEPSMSEKLQRRLQTVFARRRMDFNQFVTFIPWQSRAAFYGWLKRADVFLDTVGFSGFNTAMHAIECAAPVVTREGRFLRGRLASGILRRMGLPELITQSEEDYIALAVRLANDVGYRGHIRDRIESLRPILFEDVVPIRALEDFLIEVAC